MNSAFSCSLKTLVTSVLNVSVFPYPALSFIPLPARVQQESTARDMAFRICIAGADDGKKTLSLQLSHLLFSISVPTHCWMLVIDRNFVLTNESVLREHFIISRFFFVARLLSFAGNLQTMHIFYRNRAIVGTAYNTVCLELELDIPSKQFSIFSFSCFVLSILFLLLCFHYYHSSLPLMWLLLNATVYFHSSHFSSHFFSSLLHKSRRRI